MTLKQWGGRFTGPASAAAEQFGASLGFDIRLWPYDILGSIAHARMLGEQGIITPGDARTLVAGLRAVHARLERGEVALDPALEDVHTLVEHELRREVGEVAGRLHTARSRNDQVATDTRLYLRFALVDLAERLLAWQRALLDVAAGHLDTVMPGYTHLQRAQPVLLAHHLLAYWEMADRDLGRLRDAYARVDVLPLGSGALAGVPYPIDRSLVARLLGFRAISRNSLDAVGDRDFIVETLSLLSLIMLHLSRLAEELVLWSSSEFGFCEIDDAHATGSSIMPQKKNPDMAELVRAKTGRVVGALVALLTVVKGLPLAYNKDLQEDKEPLFEALDTTLACLDIMTEMLPAVRWRAERLRAAAAAGFSTATDYADLLVRRGLPFREAHAVVGALVRECERTGRELHDLTLAELRRFSPLFDEEALGIDLDGVVAARDVEGGTAPSRVVAALREAEQAMAASARWCDEARSRLPTLAALAEAP